MANLFKLTDCIFETGAYGVPSKSQNPTILDQGGTVEHGQLITKKYLGENKVITAEQQCLGLILCFFMHLKWPGLLRFFAVLL